MGNIVVMKVVDEDGVEHGLLTDDSNYGLVIVPEWHYHIRAENAYSLAFYHSLSASEDEYNEFTTPDSTKRYLMELEAGCSNNFNVYIYEGADVEAGTAQTPINLDRDSAETSGITAKNDSADPASGTVIVDMVSPPGQKIRWRFMPKNDTVYSIAIENKEASAAVASILLTWIEVANI